MAAPLSSKSYAKPKFVGPQNRHGGRYPDAMIKECRALLDNTQDVRHRLTIFNGMGEVIQHQCRDMMYTSDEQLHAMELCIYHGIDVQVEGLQGEHISELRRCTGSQSWRGEDRRNTWVWVKPRPGRCFGQLNGRLPSQLQ